MALTAAQRFALVHPGSPWRGVNTVPDATVPVGERLALLYLSSVSIPTPIPTSNSMPKFYIWEPRFTFDAAPITAYSWEMSPTSLGLDNFKHFGIVKLTHVSSADISLTFIVDGVSQTPITIANSGGTNYTQTILRVPVMKAKLYVVRASSLAPFRLDSRDSFFEVKDWGSDGPYRQMKIYSDFALVEG